MPKTTESARSRLAEACEAPKREEKPNITKIAREYGVSQRALYDPVKKGATARSSRKPVNEALDSAQEEALTRWIGQMNDWNMPPMPRLIQAWANRALSRAGKPSQVSKMQAYRFIKRLPPDLQLCPVKQRTKESKRIKQNTSLLAHWYDLLAICLKVYPRG
jgi:hypothetical protein